MKKQISVIFLIFSLHCSVHAQRQTSLTPPMFKQTLNEINLNHNPREKYARAERVVIRHYLSTSQLVELCLLFPKQSARYNLALTAYPNILDKQNFFDIYDVFSSNSMCMKLYHNTQANRDYSSKQPRYEQNMPRGNRSYTNKMDCSIPPNEFNYIYRSIKDQTFDDKMEEMAKKHIDKNCFSKEQFSQILKLFSHDTNILNLIKYTYPRVPYGKDMYEFRDLLDFPSSKKELDEYLLENK